jgi:hypothetical protein
MSNSIPAGGPFKAAVGLHESLTPNSIASSRKALSSYCSSPDRELCKAAIRIMKRTSDLIARARIEDLTFNDNYSGSDAPLFKRLRRIISFYSDFIAGFLVNYGDKALVKAKSNITLNNVVIEEGELLVLPVADSALLVALDLAEPVESNLLKSASMAASGSTGSGEVGGK